MIKGKILITCVSTFSCVLLFISSVFGQKKITLAHNYIVKSEKLYNMDGAEIYAIIHQDTVFLPKTNRFEFNFSRQLDSVVSQLTDKKVFFLVKTPRSVYNIDIPKDVWSRNNSFKFSFYRTPRHGSFSAFTFESISGTSPLVVKPNKEWLRKFYPYKGQ